MAEINRMELGEILGKSGQLKRLLKKLSQVRDFILLITETAVSRIKSEDDPTTAILESTFWRVPPEQEDDEPVGEGKVSCWISLGGRLVAQLDDQFYPLDAIVTEEISAKLLNVFAGYEENSKESSLFSLDFESNPIGGIDSIIQ